MIKSVMPYALMLALVGASTSCINEDLSDCPVPAEVTDVEIVYQLHFTGDIDFLAGSDVTSLHLGFWDTPANLFAEYIMSEDEVPEDMTYKLTLPRKDYRHVAMVNCQNMSDASHRAMTQSVDDVLLTQKETTNDTILAMTHASYTAATDVLLDGYDQPTYTLQVPLYPRVARYMLNVKHPTYFHNVRAYISGTLAGYYCNTGQWLSQPGLTVDASQMAIYDDSEETYFWFYAYPILPADAESKTAQQTDGDGTWKLYLYSDWGDQIVQHIFTLHQPVHEGEVMRAIFVINENSGQSNVGAGVEIDPNWKPGGDYDIEM